ncbi:MAG: hypothetical protein ABI675_25930 [Chitinophagaceae bacterium]
MEEVFQKSIFDRSLLTCVFVGIIGTLLCMFYDLFFVEYLKYPLSTIVNVATLIFGVNLVFLVIGFLFYGFITISRYGERIYIIVFILMTGFFIWKMQGVQRTDNDLVNLQFRYLSSGIIIILGLLASVAVPFLFHNKQFNKYVV